MIPIGTIVILKSGGPAMTIIEMGRTDGFYTAAWFDPQGVLQRDAFAEAEIVVVGATAVEIPVTPPEPVERPEFATGRKKIDWSTEPYPSRAKPAEAKARMPVPPLPPQKALDAPLPAPVGQAPPREKTPQRPQGGRARPKDVRARALAGALEGEGYRPPPGTIAKVVEDEDEDDKPIFDKTRAGAAGGWEKPQSSPSKAELRDQLRKAVSNTAASEEE
jgi:uncharacterized protein YodC (DUF2158 family)